MEETVKQVSLSKIESLSRQLEDLLEQFHQLFEQTQTLAYAANELKAYIRQINDNIDYAEDAVQSARETLERLK
jgi:methyl-accepting chemotaxis protein